MDDAGVVYLIGCLSLLVAVTLLTCGVFTIRSRACRVRSSSPSRLSRSPVVATW